MVPITSIMMIFFGFISMLNRDKKQSSVSRTANARGEIGINAQND